MPHRPTNLSELFWSVTGEPGRATPSSVARHSVRALKMLEGRDAADASGFGLPAFQAMLRDEVGRGEVGHAAPEYTMNGTLSQRAAVYAVGALLYHRLTGEAPPAASPQLDRMPPNLATILNRALAPAPEDRFGNLAMMRSRLEDFLNNPGLPGVPGTIDQVRPTTKTAAARMPRIVEKMRGAPGPREESVAAPLPLPLPAPPSTGQHPVLAVPAGSPLAVAAQGPVASPTATTAPGGTPAALPAALALDAPFPSSPGISAAVSGSAAAAAAPLAVEPSRVAEVEPSRKSGVVVAARSVTPISVPVLPPSAAPPPEPTPASAARTRIPRGLLWAAGGAVLVLAVVLVAWPRGDKKAPHPQPQIPPVATAQVPPVAKPVAPVAPQVPPVAPQVPPVAKPQVPPVAPQLPPVAPQVPPVAKPQVPPVAPQVPPVAPQVPPVAPQVPPVAPQVPAAVPAAFDAKVAGALVVSEMRVCFGKPRLDGGVSFGASVLFSADGVARRVYFPKDSELPQAERACVGQLTLGVKSGPLPTSAILLYKFWLDGAGGSAELRTRW